MKRSSYLYVFGFLLIAQPLFSQSVKEEKMANLSYLVGEWVGTSTAYENGEITRQIPAFEKISYDLNHSILVIELNSEALKLHTIVYFNEEDSTYYYNPFSENGSRKLPAKFLEGRLVVEASKTKRFIFEKYKEKGFREYGEEMIDGEWIIYFEDIFVNTK